MPETQDLESGNQSQQQNQSSSQEHQNQNQTMMGSVGGQLGNGLLDRKLRRRSSEKKTGGGEKVAKLHLLIDVDVKSLGLSDLQEGNVGHTWVSLEYHDPSTVPDTVNGAHVDLLRAGGRYSDPMGFWPLITFDQSGNRQGGYSTNPFKSYVPGEMKHPDREHQGAEKAVQSWELTQPEVDSVIKYAESKRGAQYSVYFYNCTTFGKEAVQAAGKSAPGMSKGGICFPNAAYDGIKKNQDKKIGHTEVTDIDSGNTTVSSNPETKKR